MAHRGGRTEGPGAMNGALKRQCATVRGLLAKAGSDEIRTRYRIGCIVLGIQNAPGMYGARGVDRMADALGCDRATLYRHGQVARTFDRKTMGRLLAAARRCPTGVSWSHLVVLAGVERPEERAKLLDRATEGMSVRELERLARSGAAALVAPSSSASALRHLVAMTESLTGRAGADVDLDVDDAAVDREILDLLARLIAAHRELREICDRKVHRYEELRAELTRRGPRLVRFPAGAA